MDLGTAWRLLLQELGRPASDSTKAKLSIAKSIRVLRDDQSFEFLEGSFSFILTAGKSTYAPGEGQAAGHGGVPFSLIKVPDRLKLSTAEGSGFVWIDRVGPQLADQQEWRDEFDGDVTTGDPVGFYWREGKFHFAPEPDTTGDIVSGRGEMDTSYPIIRSISGTLTVMTPDGRSEAPDDWTSGWLTDGFNVVVPHAKAIFVRDYMRDSALAGEMLSEWGESIRSTRASRIKKQGPVRRRLYL